jgi:hypothetical protein
VHERVVRHGSSASMMQEWVLFISCVKRTGARQVVDAQPPERML